MKNQDAMEEIFNPKLMEITIGEPDSQLLACGKNKNCELTFKGYNYLVYPCGLKIQKKNKIIDIATGREHTALLTEYGYVYVFGSTLHNKLGLEGTQVTNISLPKLLPLSQDMQLSQVACGDYHTLTLNDQGEVWGFGGTLHKKIGNKSQKPSMISGLNNINIIKIGCGDFHSVALSDQGILFTWGGGGSKYNRGQLGHGIPDDVQTPLPVKFFQNSPVYDFECGGYHTVSIQQDGEVFAWGNGQYGQLGNGTFEDSSIPKRVQVPEDKVILQVACGGHHSYYLSKEGKLYSCGKGTQGQTGQLKAVNYPIPTLVQSLQHKFVEQISCGWNHAIALVNPNYVYSTGLNNFGQLGLGHQDNKMSFTWIERLGGKNIATIKAGGDHSWFLIDIENPEVQDFRPPSPLYNPQDEPVDKKKSIKRETSKNFLDKTTKSNFRERMSNKNLNIGPRSYMQDVNDPNQNRQPNDQGNNRLNDSGRRINPIQGTKLYPNNDNLIGEGNPYPSTNNEGNIQYNNRQNQMGQIKNYHGDDNRNINRQNLENPDESIFVDEDDSQVEVFPEEIEDSQIEQGQNIPQKNVFKNSVQDVQFDRESQNFNSERNDNLQPDNFQNPHTQLTPGNPTYQQQDLNPLNPQSLKSLENSSKKPPKNQMKKSFLKNQPDQKPEVKPRKKYGMRQTSNFLKEPTKKPKAQQDQPSLQQKPQNIYGDHQTFEDNDPYKRFQVKEDPDDPFNLEHKNKVRPDKPTEYRSQPNQPIKYPQNFINQPPIMVDENQKNFMINKIWQASSYNMLLVNLELNHKFILLDFKPNMQNELVQAIHNSIEQISTEDPILMQYDVIKYNDFVSKDDKGFLKRVMNQTVQIDQAMSENIFVVMLVQQQNRFMQQYTYNVPDSNYQMLNFRESSLGPFYQFYPDEIEKDKKWKMLSHAYEILLSNVFQYINLFTIYELRSSKYK